MPDSVSNSVLGSSPLVLPRFDLYDPNQPLNLGGYASDNLFVHTNPYIGLAGFDNNGVPVPDTSSAPTSVMLDPTRSPGFLAARALMQSVAQEYGWNNDGSSTPASNPTTTPANTDSTEEDDDEDDDQPFDGRAAMEQAFAPRDSGGGDNTAPSPNIQPAPLPSTGNGPVSLTTQPPIPETNASSLPSWWNQPVVTPSSPASAAPSMRLFGDDSLDTSPSIATLTPRYSNPPGDTTADASIPGPALASSSGPVFLKPQTPVTETNPPPFSAPYGVSPASLPMPLPAMRLSDAYSLPPTYSLPTQARDSQPVLSTDGPMYEPTIGFDPWGIPGPTMTATTPDQGVNGWDGKMRLPRLPDLKLPHWHMGHGTTARRTGDAFPDPKNPSLGYRSPATIDGVPTIFPTEMPPPAQIGSPVPSGLGTSSDSTPQPRLFQTQLGPAASTPLTNGPDVSPPADLTAAWPAVYADIQTADTHYDPAVSRGLHLFTPTVPLYRKPSFTNPTLSADTFSVANPAPIHSIVSRGNHAQQPTIPSRPQLSAFPYVIQPITRQVMPTSQPVNGSLDSDRAIENAYRFLPYLNPFPVLHTGLLKALADPSRWPYITALPEKPGDRSPLGFAKNAWNDALGLIQGLTQLPRVGKEVIEKVVDSSFYNVLAQWDDMHHNEAARRVHQAQADADGDWLWGMLTGVVGGEHGVVSELGMLAGDGSLLVDPRTDPRTLAIALNDLESRGLRTWQGIVDYSYHHPAQQALNLLMVGEASAAAREAELGRAIKEAEVAGDEAKAARLRLARARVGEAKTAMQTASHNLTTMGVPEGVKLLGRGVGRLLEGQTAYRNARNMAQSVAGRAITNASMTRIESPPGPPIGREVAREQSVVQPQIHQPASTSIRDQSDIHSRRNLESNPEITSPSGKANMPHNGQSSKVLPSNWEDIKRYFSKTPDPTDLDRLTEEFQTLNNIVKKMTNLTSNWSGVVNISDELTLWGDPEFQGRKEFECPITMHRHTLLKSIGDRMSTMIHETFHAFSNGLNEVDYTDFPGYEEAVVEQCTHLYGKDVFTEAKIRDPFPAQKAYPEYIDAMEVCREIAGETNAKKFYIDLLKTPLKERELEVHILALRRYNGTIPPPALERLEKAMDTLHTPYKTLQNR